MIFTELPARLTLHQVRCSIGDVLWTTTPLASDERLGVAYFYPQKSEKNNGDIAPDSSADSALQRSVARA